MSAFEVVLTRKAKTQLKAIACWWAENCSTAEAEEWYDKAHAAIDSQTSNPMRCSFARENAALEIELRQLLFGKGRKVTHRALFVVKKSQVIVYAIRHLAQNDVQADDLEN